MCVALFFIIARCLAPNFLFYQYQAFGKEISYRFAITFLILYTIYNVNKIIWFSLRKNRFFSSVYGSIRRFLVSYVWCLYIGIIPFYLWDPNDFGWDVSVYVLQKFGFFSVEVLEKIATGLCIASMILSLYLMALILAQRFMVACYLAVMNKLIVKSEENAQIWRSEEELTSATRYTIHHFAILLGEFCYRFAMNILSAAICGFTFCIWLSLAYGGLGMFTEIALIGLAWIWVRIAFCYLAFSIIVRSLFRAIRRRVRLYASRQV